MYEHSKEATNISDGDPRTESYFSRLHYLHCNSVTVIGRLLEDLRCKLRKSLIFESKKKKNKYSQKKFREQQELINYKNLNCHLAMLKIRKDFIITGYRSIGLESLCWSHRIRLVASSERSVSWGAARKTANEKLGEKRATVSFHPRVFALRPN